MQAPSCLVFSVICCFDCSLVLPMVRGCLCRDSRSCTCAFKAFASYCACVVLPILHVTSVNARGSSHPGTKFKRLDTCLARAHWCKQYPPGAAAAGPGHRTTAQCSALLPPPARHSQRAAPGPECQAPHAQPDSVQTPPGCANGRALRALVGGCICGRSPGCQTWYSCGQCSASFRRAPPRAPARRLFAAAPPASAPRLGRA